MFNFFSWKKVSKFFSFFLNSKITYIILVLIILVQFILVSVIFFQNKKSKYIIEQTNFKAATVENQQKQLNEKMNSLQSSIMRMSSQLYRMQTEEIK
ncbi:hypothetical protein KKC83_01465 [Patescibacteria group bacterium]|nr:hypothetical protein [Candidatus Falkowbacteria bacterium]MBU3906049.1 hypothetical protein [Patescibacteria group bacterium]MBU4015078.1 hypothetical protein [Patescibacteria group bacterium]MBU4026194.1 hypothetical protein [Patescibacteria group bacterium]MBU4073698.1 hypothetical protein [Patescibacteria group bacterium]